MEELCELYGVTTQEELLQTFLKGLRGKSVPQQLRARRITRFKTVERWIGKATLAKMNQKRYGFLITLIESRAKWWALDIGHELGHTFFYDITKSPPDDRLHNIRGKRGKREERFCNHFAQIWARRYGKELTALLEEFGFSDDGLNRMVRLRR